MKRKTSVNFAIVVLCLSLSGCAGITSESLMNITDETGKVIGKITGTAAQRDFFYTNMHIERDKRYAAMYEDSGVVIEWEMKEVKPGIFVQVMKKTTIRSAPQFQQDLAVQPPDHRGWDSLDKAFNVATFGIGAYFLNDFGKTAVKSSGNKYHGPYKSNNPTDNSITKDYTAPPYFAPSY